jgi:hypothetical protein
MQRNDSRPWQLAHVDHAAVRILATCNELLKRVLLTSEAVALRLAVGLMNLVRQLLEPTFQQFNEQGTLVVVERQCADKAPLSRKAWPRSFSP